MLLTTQVSKILGEPSMRWYIIKKELRLDMDLVEVVIKANLFLYAYNTKRIDEHLRVFSCMH